MQQNESFPSADPISSVQTSLKVLLFIFGFVIVLHPPITVPLTSTIMFLSLERERERERKRERESSIIVDVSDTNWWV